MTRRTPRILLRMACCLLALLAVAAQGADGPYVSKTADGRLLARWVDSLDSKVRERTTSVGQTVTIDGVGGVPAFNVRLRDPAALAAQEIATRPKTPLFVVADTHGEYEILVELLRANRIVDDSLRWSFGRGHLVILGDVFDVGQHQTEILWLIYKLEGEAARAGGDVHLVLGNHETMALLGDHRYLDARYEQTARALGASSYAELFARTSVLGQWLRTRPAVLKLNDFLFLHGGISRAIVDQGLSLEQTNSAVRGTLNGDLQTQDDRERSALVMGQEGPLWYRGYFPAERDFVTATADDVDRILMQFKVSKIFVGHTMVPTVTPLYRGKVVAVQVYPRRDARSGRAIMEAVALDNDQWMRARIDGVREPLFGKTSGAASRALLLQNATIHTGATSQPRAEAVLAVDGRIVFVGSDAEALRQAPADVRTLDLSGFTVLPGLADSHAHLAGIGWRELYFDLTGVESLAALQQRLRERAATDKGAWIQGRGWIESRWTPAAFPTRADLDAVISDRPVVLERIDGHAIVVNSLALKKAGITRDTPNPPGGEILRDPATGEPTGMLVDNARPLVEDLVPPPTDEETRLALETGANRSVRVGWTQLQYAGTTNTEIDLLCRLYAEDRIKLRTYVAIQGPGRDAEELLRFGPIDRSCDDRLVVRGLKLYMDGALGSRGAALLAPYSDSPQSQGLLVNDPAEILRIARAALRSGVQVETHAIGDRGNRLVLDAYEKAFASVPVSQRAVAEPRFRIEHAQVLDPADIPRFAKLGVIASMQTSHAISDMFFAPQRLGPVRIKGAYAWRRLLDAGAILTGGSDAPVEQGDPIIEFYAAVTRRTLDGYAGPDWGLDQRLTRDEALKLLTYWPAYAAFQEKERGTIEAGKLADFTVLSSDIMQVPDAEILKAHVVMTIIGGQIAYSAGGQ